MNGAFITFEGGEGSGKSTQLRLFVERLRAAGAPVVALREPGGTVVGDLVRELLLDPAHSGLDARAEVLLYEASRAELVASVIRPELSAGGIVVCDRFADSTTAYQGYGRGLPLDEVERLNDAATDGLAPDLTVLLDIHPALGLARATGGGADRLEREALDFHERVRAGFLAIAAAEPERVAVLDADRPVQAVAADVLEAARRVPSLHGYLGRRR